MKQTRYEIIYMNDLTTAVYCFTFIEAIALGITRAIEQGKDTRIKYVSDEKGNTIKDIKIDYHFVPMP